MQQLKIHGLIFDFDGTLVDSMGLWHEIDIAYLNKRGLQCPENLAFEISGKSMLETAEYFKLRFQLSESIDEILAEWDGMSFDAILGGIPFKPGVLEFISWISKKRIPMAIASSNSRKNLEAFLPQHNLESCFHSLHFSGEVGKGKPDPLVFLETAKALDLPPENCLVFEDTLEGVQGALSAGMPVFSVDDYYQQKRVHSIKELSLYHIKDFRELINEGFSSTLVRRNKNGNSL
ncbi:MAG: HAD family hydrolase [Eubacteriaceae bacterium]